MQKLPNITINSEVYYHQPDKLNDSRKQKEPESINSKGCEHEVKQMRLQIMMPHHQTQSAAVCLGVKGLVDGFNHPPLTYIQLMIS
ncbi:hypothetical protein CDAR_613211 [Caerostris darwini]|uniref:Uncharacterized protein n=1 Tax=Caerostris darwini TaxID=1538125 RepID=A0AAV4UL38_9ARAC|nr:hypothetical protein CDAR_613211 [Caerostris darwini]